MHGIAKIDDSGGPAAFSYPDEHPVVALWLGPEHGLLHRLRNAMQTADAHPARTLVLLPYAQLRPLASRLWMRAFGDGFAPQFETTMNWCNAQGAFRAGATDLRLNPAWDLLTARSLLAQAGLDGQGDLAAMLVQAAHQLAPLAAACPPAARLAWAEQARQSAALGLAGGVLNWESALARIASEWVAHSAFASDLLFDPASCDSLDLLVVVQGISADPLAAGLRALWGAKLVTLPLDAAVPDAMPPAGAAVGLHACGDAEDEAQRCAAQALLRIGQGQFPIALVSSDRALTRRVRALLEGAGVAMRDENGWKLSTSHAAAGVMALLQASAWNATSDQVLNWLKHTPADFAAQRDALEAALRRDPMRDWRNAARASGVHRHPELLAWVRQLDLARNRLAGTHTLAQWLGLLRAALEHCGMWEPLQADGAGVAVLEALLLLDADGSAQVLLSESLWSQRRMDMAEFTRWVQDALEAQSYKPAYPAQEQLVILPMSQILGRPFAAVLLAGCDEARLLPSAEPAGQWSAAQRAAFGLASRAELQAQTAAAWRNALRTPLCDVFWRTSDETGEALLASALVQSLQLDPSCAAAVDPRVWRAIDPVTAVRPAPSAPLLVPSVLTQGAYDDLRQCPYRFFALRQLQLQTVEELESEVDKRDFGVWLHAVLHRFHLGLAEQPTDDPARLAAMLDASSDAVTADMALLPGEFLPFAASWPAVRSGYLTWLAEHEQQEHAVFRSGELDCRQVLGSVRLQGRVDRVDALTDGSVMVLDYKTESIDKTRARVKDPLEDTQMAFYAALMPQDTLRGAYVNISEKLTTSVEQVALVEARDALVAGILADLQHMADGAAMPALGQGSACDYCQARGMCRKDFWLMAGEGAA